MADAKRTTTLLTELSDLATQLNAASDSINTIIRKFETTLQSFNIGLEVWLYGDHLEALDEPFDEAADTHGREATDTELGFCRYADQWVLCVRSATYRIDRGYLGIAEWRRVSASDPRPLLKASRTDRLASLGQFEDLLTTLRDAAKESLEAIQEAKSFVEQC